VTADGESEFYGTVMVVKFCEIFGDRNCRSCGRNRDQPSNGEWKSWAELFDPSFYLLAAEYGIFHMVALSVTAILAAVFSVRIRSILYLLLSVIGLLTSIYMYNQSKYGGLHLFIICWGSLVLIALDYVWRANTASE
jgi:hypothetical protein